MAKAAAFLGLSWLAQYACAKDVRHSWNITWVNAAPNGHERPVIGINNQWPCPQLDVDLGDRLIVEVYNGLGDQNTGIHWHGFNQYMTGTMDGSVGTTQCGIEPGSKITYDFVVNQTGTYWYHSHEMGQYPDGLRGALNVHDPSPPFHYDAEFTLTLSDWYNDQMTSLLQYYQSEENLRDNGGDEPLPDSALINDRTGPKIKVEPNKTYLVRIVCLGNWPGHTFVFDDHEMTVVEVDGIYTEPYDVTDKKLRITTGQRTSVLIHTKSDVSRNYAFWDTMDINMMFLYENRSVPETFNPNATAWLVYDETKELPPPPDIHSLDPNADFIDDVSFVPEDGERLLEPADRQLILHTSSREINGVQRFTVNGETYLPQDVPSLYTAMTSENSSDPAVYGQVNPIVVHHGEIVEIVINNYHANLHPWHLHGHQFQVLQRSAVDGGSFHGYFRNVSSTPIKRDTIMVQNNGHVVIRFRADNPGVWLLHCHIEWHVVSGLTATLIEAPESINYTIPQDHRQLCSSYGIPTSGNAAGNSGNDLSGANTEVTPSNGASSSKSPGSSSSSAIVVSSSSSRPTYSSARPIYSSIRPIGHSSTPSQTSSSLVTPKPQSTHSPTSTPTTSQTSSSLITPKPQSTHSPTSTPTPSPTPTPKPEATPEVTPDLEPEDDTSDDGYEDEGYVDPEYTGPPDGPTTVAALGDYNFVWVEGRKSPGHVSIAHAPKATSSQR